MCSRLVKGNDLEANSEIIDHQDNKGYYLDNDIYYQWYILEDNLQPQCNKRSLFGKDKRVMGRLWRLAFGVF
jgi:hypothetical protein